MRHEPDASVEQQNRMTKYKIQKKEDVGREEEGKK
jgi:hypothetical protein